MPDTYSDRNKRLKGMGYDSYDQYLASPLWASIRAVAFQQHGNACVLCHNRAEVIHHIGYGLLTLNGFRMDSLAPLCHQCHAAIEFTSGGKKRSLSQAQSAYRKLLKGSGDKRSKARTEVCKRLKGNCKQCGYKARKGFPYCRRCAADLGVEQIAPELIARGEGRPLWRPCPNCSRPLHKYQNTCRICCPRPPRSKRVQLKCAGCGKWAKRNKTLCRPCLKEKRASK